MYEPSAFHHRDSITRHPPYGLFIDPHKGRHNWTGLNLPVLLGLLTFMASILVVVTFLPH